MARPENGLRRRRGQSHRGHIASRSRATQQFASRPHLSPREVLWFDAVVNISTDAILIIEGSGRIVVFNPAAERIFRCSEAEALGQRASRFIPDLKQRRATIEPRGSATRDHSVRIAPVMMVRSFPRRSPSSRSLLQQQRRGS